MLSDKLEMVFLAINSFLISLGGCDTDFFQC